MILSRDVRRFFTVYGVLLSCGLTMATAGLAATGFLLTLVYDAMKARG